MTTETTTPEKIDYNELTDEQLELMLKNRKALKQQQQQQQRDSYEALKEQTVNDLCEHAIQLNGYLTQFKQHGMQSMETLYKLLQEYSKRHQDGEGNFFVENAACTFKATYTRQDLGYFDERSTQAEKHIIEFVNTQFAGDPKFLKLITNLLERKKDKLDIKLVQKLYTMENDYDDPNWLEGIKLLKESWKVTESKSYVRFYRKVSGNYALINLNLGSLDITEQPNKSE